LKEVARAEGVLGAGEGARTLDPDLGKVVDRQFPAIYGDASMSVSLENI
jgi:hypothetical protein